MKKTIIGIFVLILICILMRIIFSYTIISIPYTTGYVFEGGTKHDFPICIVNPIKSEQLKKEILNDVQSRLAVHCVMVSNEVTYDNRQYKQFFRWFHGRLNHIPNIIIAAIKSEKKGYYILLQAADNADIQCVVFIDKKTNAIRYIDF